MHKSISKSLLLFLVVMFFITACGGGGGGTPSEEPRGSSNWDEMVWDRDNWG